ncbi:M10 family metallopeptidase C-terminal domain-containing protein [Caulobacter segnis]|uniref:M10 family metallopeptidase n=1 Tax=Caulobacter segnis TaxID=88688 RepID=UPI00240ED723|nr:M10 family metallopeptidase [Caulobacter segnis]MDG2522799.1 M10 family metallopeptidase C-terminal domain-containing protein [Caulobacter segnis]
MAFDQEWQTCGCAACAAGLTAHETISAGDGTLSAAAASKPVWSANQIITNYDRNNLSWSSGTVLYSFMNTGTSSVGADFKALTAEERIYTRAAFDLIADVINLKFVETVDDGSSNGRIRFGSDNGAEDFEWGHASWRRSGSDLRSVEVWLNPDATAERKWFFGGYNFMALMHEIVHGLGALHPGDYNANGGKITYADHATFMQDSRQYTIMSYFQASETGADFLFDADNAIYSGSTLLLHDVAGLQAMYGANMSTRAGDTVYGYNSTAGRASYDFTQTKQPIVTLWDGGGNDTLDLSGTNLVSRIDLNAGAFSDALSMTKNISIAYGVTIENARGGGGNDSITGNAADNKLEGRGGNDTIDGGAGTDTAVYSGARANYSWTANADGTITIRDLRSGSPDGTDTLKSIEKLQFTDTTITLSGGGGATPSVSLDVAFANILRHAPATDAEKALLNSLTSQVAMGTISQAQAYQQIADAAAGTTKVAALAYQFFVGSTPSEGGMDYLLTSAGGNANHLNSAYYTSFNVENRYINFAVNLGKMGEGKAAFQTAYGALSFDEAVSKAYATIFGSTPTATKIDQIVDANVGAGMTRLDYFASYGGDHELGAKAAMVGWLLTEAEKAGVGVYAKAVDAYLMDLADGAAFGVNLIGAYGSSAFVYSDLG